MNPLSYQALPTEIQLKSFIKILDNVLVHGRLRGSRTFCSSTVKQATSKNISSITTTTTIPQGQSRLRSPSTGNDPQVHDKNSERESRDRSNMTDNQGYETEMISLITPYFLNYLNNYPVNNHSAFIQKCFQNALDQATDIASFEISINIMDNNRLLMMLQKSAALREYMIFSFGHDQKIVYELAQKAMEELDQKTTNYRYEITTSADLEKFHSKIFSCMKNWAITHSSEFYATMWMDAIEQDFLYME
jgi:hypothetical protein